MRVSLWPGLLKAALENQRRQQDRIRLFEHGARFLATEGQGLERDAEIDTLAGIACGHRLPEQWGLPPDMREPVDFFDVKGDVEALLAATGAAAEFTLRAAARSRVCIRAGRRGCCAGARRSAGWGSCTPRW